MYAIQRLDHVALTVRDLDASARWYARVLGMEQRGTYRDATGRGNPRVLGSGDANLALFPGEPGRAVLPLEGHVALRLDRASFDLARAHLNHLGVPFKYVEYETVHSMYLQDPDGNEIELSTWELERET